MIESYYAQQRLQRSILPNIYRTRWVRLLLLLMMRADAICVRCHWPMIAAHTHTHTDRVRYIWILRSLVRNSSGTAIGAPHHAATCRIHWTRSVIARPRRRRALLISQSHARQDGWMQAQCDSKLKSIILKIFQKPKKKKLIRFEFVLSRATDRRRQFALGQPKVATETPQRLSNICKSSRVESRRVESSVSFNQSLNTCDRAANWQSTRSDHKRQTRTRKSVVTGKKRNHRESQVK